MLCGAVAESLRDGWVVYQFVLTLLLNFINHHFVL
uniref:Uncharacterized protein n=1 Tax=Arundo donax TaxID=35708 RepID=A0A0A8ZQV9_ARUDO